MCCMKIECYSCCCNGHCTSKPSKGEFVEQNFKIEIKDRYITVHISDRLFSEGCSHEWNKIFDSERSSISKLNNFGMRLREIFINEFKYKGCVDIYFEPYKIEFKAATCYNVHEIKQKITWILNRIF